MKLFKTVSIIALVLTTHLAADADRFQGKGFVQNDHGDKCWYTQKVDPESTYFQGSLTNSVGIMTFDDADCMSDSGVGLDTNKMMINNVISRWYSHSDANFRTRVHELYDSSLLQKKGQCIQSGTYPTIGIMVNYLVINNAITGVIHGASVQGCKNKMVTSSSKSPANIGIGEVIVGAFNAIVTALIIHVIPPLNALAFPPIVWLYWSHETEPERGPASS